MTRALACAVALSAAIAAGPATARAQDTTVVEVDVTVHVEVPTPPPPTVVVAPAEPAPPPVVVVTLAEPAPPVVVVAPAEPAPPPPPEPAPPPEPVAEAATRRSSIVPLLHGRLEMLLVDGDYTIGAWGGSALLGAEIGRGWSAGVVIGYLAEIGSGPSEVDLGIEVAKDFSPADAFGFVVLARLGTAFALGGDEPSIAGLGPDVRMMGQLGVGARVSVDEHVAVTLDVRGVLRYRPARGAFDTRSEEVTGGAAITTGLRMRL